MWALLTSIAASGTTVVAVCSEAPEGAVTVSTARTGKPTGTGDGPDTTGGPRPADEPEATGGPRPAHEPDGTTEPHAARDLRTKADAHPTDEKETADALTETGRS